MFDLTIMEANVAVWPVVVAGAVGWIIGAVWYGVFAKPWTALAYPGKKPEQIESSPAIYGVSLLLYMVFALALALVASYYDAATLGDGLVVGLLTFVGFIGTALAINYMYSGRPAKLFLIDAGNYLVAFLAMGAIIGGWQ